MEDDDDGEKLDVFRYAPRSVLVVLFVVFLVVIAFSNISVLLVLLTSSKMRTSTNTYIMSICTASFLVGVFACASSLHELVGSEEIGSADPATCVALVYLELLSITACVFSFTAIAVDRYRTIVQAHKPRFTLKTTYIILGVGWILGGIYGSRSVLQSTHSLQYDDGEHNDNKTFSPFGNETSHHPEDERQICSNFLEDEGGDFIFRIIDIIVLFLVPFIIMFVLYSLIGLKLWSAAVPSNNSIREKRKTVRLLVIIVVLFFACWSPFHVFEVVHDALETQGFELEKEAFAGVRVWSLVLAISNSWLNPVVYCYMNRSFRTELKIIVTRKIECFGICRALSNNQVRPTTDTTHDTG